VKITRSTWCFLGPTDGSADYADPDHDLMSNWQEWRCLAEPTNSLSVLKMLGGSNAVSGVAVSWQSVAGVNPAALEQTWV
jgi:hypothetical protein